MVNNVSKRDTSPRENPERDIDLLAKRASVIIFTARARSPFALFQNEITICPNRVTVVDKGLFLYDEYPMPIESINGARVVRTLFFAALHIDTFGVQKPPPLEYMRFGDARLARRYILALIECKRNGIDLSKFGLDELSERLLEIGRVREGKGDNI